MNIILASQSPRRKELLERMGLSGFEIIPARGDENCRPGCTPAEMVEELSRRKCAEVAASRPDALVIAADTVVAIDNQILGKPRGGEQAARMLRLLSGREHRVYTGVTVIKDGKASSRAEMTQVHFRAMTEEEIRSYIATGEPMDKAGAYGYQGRAGVYVQRIEGDFFNVVGLPLCLLGNMLKELGVIG